MNKEKFINLLKSIDLDKFDAEYFSWKDEDNNKYGFLFIKEGQWIDDGKYSEKVSTCKLFNINTNEEYDFGIRISECRSGSYFSDYYYNEPIIDRFEIQKVEIPEQIIPAHTEDKFIYFEK